MHIHTLSFRAPDEFVQETLAAATRAGLKKSDYVREAVREKNERTMAEHIAALSRELSAEHLAFNESLDDTIADGLD
jgi:Arc/MetJ-type ribon-helix-helix transcriptional regulator